MSAVTQTFITQLKRWGRLKPLPPEEERDHDDELRRYSQIRVGVDCG